MTVSPSTSPTLPSATEADRSSVPAAEPLWVVCLCAEWCGACREYRALFERVAGAHPALRFAWVDIEDHAHLADDFDVETFPTILIAGPSGTRFIGPLLPHAETLTRLLSALPAGEPQTDVVKSLLEALHSDPKTFEISPLSR